MSDTAITNEQIIQSDLILRLLRLKWKWSSTQIIVFVSSLSGFLFIVVGGIASWSYAGVGNRITSRGNLLFFAMWLVVFAPLMWGAYLWQARIFPSLIISLVRNGVFGPPASNNRQKMVEYASHLLNSMSHPVIYLVALLVLLVFWVNEFLVAWPEQFGISPEYWFEVKWYLPIHILVWSISLYVLFLFVFRQVVFIFGMSRFLNRSEIRVKPLDPDECGGLGAIGNFIKTSILLAVGLGGTAVLFALEVYWSGSDVLRRTDVLALFSLYVVLTPFCLIVPVLSTRNAMLRARQRVLSPIADEFQAAISLIHSKIPQDSSDLKELNEKLKQLQQYREMILQSYPTSPLPLGVLRKFSITATIPFLSGVASVALQLLLS